MYSAKENTMNKRAVIYARFSSHTQTEQSIEGQLRECYDYAKHHDLFIVGEYIDRALTGTTDKRPNFLQMIDDSKKKTFDYVLVYQLDRFARNRYDSANYKAKLKKNGVRVLSAKENITEDASGILIEGVLESMAEYYSAELSQKVRRGIRESLSKGYFIGGYKLFGYDIVDKRWTINPIEASIVKDMFERYKNGEKAKSIVNRLNEMGVHNKSGAKFTVNSFAKIIRNSKYMGVVISNGTTYTNIVPAIAAGIVTKSTKEKLLALEQQNDELESKIAVEKARQIQPFDVDKLRAFLNYFARKQYANDEEKNEFFNSFIYRVVLFDDCVYIFYNTSPQTPTKFKLDKSDLTELREYRKNRKSTRFQPLGFKSGALGGETGI